MGDNMTIKNIILDRHAVAKVWLEELPLAIYSADYLITEVIDKNLKNNSVTRKAALEIIVPVGPKSLYGLLGAEFEPNDSGHLVLEVLVSTDNEPIYTKSLANDLDLVKVGLPSEYKESVVDGILDHLKNNQISHQLGSGILKIDRAAHGEINSSNKFFRQIAITLIQLLMLEGAISDTEVTDIINTNNALLFR